MSQSAQNLTEQKKNKFPVPNWLIIVFFVAMAIILIGGLVNFYQRQSHQIYMRNANELKSIAELKVNQILQWREERISDIEIYSSNLLMGTIYESCQQVIVDENTHAELQAQFQLITNTEGYENIFITTCDGTLLFSAHKIDHPLENETLNIISQASNQQEIVFGDIYRSTYTNNLFIDIATPVFNEQNQTIMFLILRVDPNQTLFPIIQSWPTPSQTAETLIIRKDDDHVLFLNSLRHDASQPLTIEIPLSKTNVPAVQAIMGTSGVFAGVDYRGEDVLSEIHPIPGTNWYMISKEDESELLQERRSLSQYIIFMMVFSIILTISLAAYIFNRRQRILYSDLYLSEQIKNIAEEETRITLYSIGDGVITTDADGLITRLNPIAEELTGWQEEESIGKPISDIFRIINEQSRKSVVSPVQEVLQKGLIVGLANHTVLISKDGTERPIADSGAPIRNNKGEIIGVVLVFRDQTEERAVQKEKALLYDSLSASLDEIYIFDADTLRFRYANTGALNNLGYSLDEFSTLTPLDIKPDINFENFQELISPLQEDSKKMVVFTTSHQRKDGSIYPIETRIQLFTNEDEKVYLAVVQDITKKLAQEEKIRKSEEQYTQLFTEMEEGFALHEIILDENGKPIDYRFLDVNPAFEQQTGLYKKNIQYKTIREILPNIENYWIETYGEVTLERKSIKYENYSAPFDKWFSVSAFCPKEKQFATISIDITEQKKSAQAVVESEERFRSLFENMAQGVLYHNPAGEIVLANEAAKNILGLSQSELMGKTSSDSRWKSIHEDGSEFPAELHPAVVAQKTGKVINNVIMGVYNGIRQQYVWININAVPQFQRGEKIPYQTFVTIEDVTAQKIAEDTLKQQLDELRRWNEVVLGREGRVLELKQEINKLLELLGKPPKYTSAMKGE